MEIFLVTSNPNKVREFKLALEPDIKVKHVDYDYPELRSDDPEEIVHLAARQVADKLQKPVVVEDSGFFIESLQGFPGTCTKYIHNRIGNSGFLQLMKGKTNRICFYKSVIGFCMPGQEPTSFLGIEQGEVSTEERGSNGWGQDSIFIPQGNAKTYGEIRTKEDINKFRDQALQKLREFLLS